jgi:outer membrane protein TolC
MKKIFFSVIVLFSVGMAGSIMAQTASEVLLPTLHGAIETGLKNNYDIKINQQLVEISKGEKQATRGAFDLLLGFDVSTLSGISFSDMTKDPSSMDVYLYLPTQWGVNATTGFSYSRLRDLTNKDQTEIVNGAWFQLDVPIFKGLGKTNKNLINFKIAELNMTASQTNFDYEIMRFIKDVALAYLNVFYKNQAYNSRVLIIKDLEEYKNGIQLKIDNNVVPSAEIMNVNTELAQMKSDLSPSFNEIKNAYLDLLKLLGAETTQLKMETFSIPFTFPGIDDKRIKGYINDIITRREDIINQSPAFKKQKLTEESVLHEVKIAEYDKRSDLQLQMKYNYFSALDGGRWNSFWIYPQSTFPGSSYLLTLSYKLPLGNRTARGLYAAKKGEYESQKTASDKLFLEMEKSIEALSNDLSNSLEVLGMQKEITEFRKQIYLNEVLKYDIGNSTQIDVLNSHQNYMEALLTIYVKEYIVIANWLNLKFLCNDIPQNVGQLPYLLK